MPPDMRYRDKCIVGARLPVTAFDTETGQLLGETTGPTLGDSYPEGTADSPGDSSSAAGS